MEGAIPTELDKDTLATLGETRFDGAIVGAFSAHPHRVVKRRTTYNFGLRYGRETFIDLYALPDEGAPSRIGEIKLPAAVMLHDFIATENHLVFFVAPLRVVIWRALLQAGSFSDLFEYDASAGTEVIVVPIDRPTEPRRFNVDAFFQWHFANAFETVDAIVVDFVRYPDAGSFTSIGGAEIAGGQLVRAEIGRAKDALTMHVLEGSEGDFPLSDPRFAGATHDVVFRTSEDPRGSGLSRFDVRDGRLSAFKDDHTRAYSEAIFVPKHAGAKEGEGHLLSLVLDARTEKSYVAVLDAEHIEDGPIARAWFEHAIPMTFHGTFVPG
jgi:all-trans-8'-apo-beta-carotenal 15,15'-oxygenase